MFFESFFQIPFQCTLNEWRKHVFGASSRSLPNLFCHHFWNHKFVLLSNFQRCHRMRFRTARKADCNSINFPHRQRSTLGSSILEQLFVLFLTTHQICDLVARNRRCSGNDLRTSHSITTKHPNVEMLDDRIAKALKEHLGLWRQGAYMIYEHFSSTGRSQRNYFGILWICARHSQTRRWSWIRSTMGRSPILFDGNSKGWHTLENMYRHNSDIRNNRRPHLLCTIKIRNWRMNQQQTRVKRGTSIR